MAKNVIKLSDHIKVKMPEDKLAGDGHYACLNIGASTKDQKSSVSEEFSVGPFKTHAEAEEYFQEYFAQPLEALEEINQVPFSVTESFFEYCGNGTPPLLHTFKPEELEIDLFYSNPFGSVLNLANKRHLKEQVELHGELGGAFNE